MFRFIPNQKYSKIDKNMVHFENLAHIERQSLILIETLCNSTLDTVVSFQLSTVSIVLYIFEEKTQLVT